MSTRLQDNVEPSFFQPRRLACNLLSRNSIYKRRGREKINKIEIVPGRRGVYLWSRGPPSDSGGVVL